MVQGLLTQGREMSHGALYFLLSLSSGKKRGEKEGENLRIGPSPGERTGSDQPAFFVNLRTHEVGKKGEKERVCKKSQGNAT